MDDRASVTALLGRPPRGAFAVVVRDVSGGPVVLRNAPLLDDGTPMPTRYWLCGAEVREAVSRLEAAGGVREAEAAVDPAELAAAHRRHAAERDAALPPDLVGPRPSGGVGGTRAGVKCLHAHYAWHLAGGDDPVGRWVADRLASQDQVTSERRERGPGGPVAGQEQATAERGPSRPAAGQEQATSERGPVRARPQEPSERTDRLPSGPTSGHERAR